MFFFNNNLLIEKITYIADIIYNGKSKPVLFDTATTENEKSRIDFEISLKFYK